MRNALASLVAVTMACPEDSNHLWYHLYSPDQLEDTQITGFLVIQADMGLKVKFVLS